MRLSAHTMKNLLHSCKGKGVFGKMAGLGIVPAQRAKYVGASLAPTRFLERRKHFRACHATNRSTTCRTSLSGDTGGALSKIVRWPGARKCQ